MNPGPLDPQSSTLPTAPHPDIVCIPYLFEMQNSRSIINQIVLLFNKKRLKIILEQVIEEFGTGLPAVVCLHSIKAIQKESVKR